MGVQKNQKAPKNQKIIEFLGFKKGKSLIFSKNRKSEIWLNIGGGSPSGMGHHGTFRPLDTIQKVPT